MLAGIHHHQKLLRRKAQAGLGVEDRSEGATIQMHTPADGGPSTPPPSTVRVPSAYLGCHITECRCELATMQVHHPDCEHTEGTEMHELRIPPDLHIKCHVGSAD